MADIWKPAQYQVHHGSTAVTVVGYTYRELGLHMLTERGKVPTWSLTHLGTGLRICNITGKVAVSFPVATEIAEAGDWGFISMVGYKDRFPESANKLREILGRHKNAKRVWRKIDNDEREAIRSVAQQIAATR